jgi:prolyl-tRNA editing enzyme YbaK/EbsC (Cys-tRNA(Pro) deacylase)
VLPADEQVDLKALRQHLGTSHAKLASMDKIPQITGVDVSIVPPLGSLMHLKTIAHPSLVGYDEITFVAAKKDKHITIKWADFALIEQPDLVSPAAD